jgi:hypothetical protein
VIPALLFVGITWCSACNLNYCAGVKQTNNGWRWPSSPLCLTTGASGHTFPLFEQYTLFDLFIKPSLPQSLPSVTHFSAISEN